MIGGLLFSRAIPSIAMMLFGITALWGISPRQLLKQRWWLFGLGWVALYALSYFWSADKGEWNAHLQVKLPFLLLPLSFALLPPFTAKDWRIYTWCLSLFMLAGGAYSISFLWRADADHLFSQYLVFAHLLPTPMYDDHIAFSSAVALTVAWIVYWLPNLPERWERIVLGIICCLLIIYLHVLAAKTGLIALYIFLLGYMVYQLRNSWKKGLVILLAIAGFLTVALVSLPTLRARINYSYTTWRSYRMGERDALYSDASRMISYDLALKSITKHPLGGVGAGDVLHDMHEEYSRWYPQVPEEQQLWPHNQWLTCAMAAGIPAVLLFTLWVAAPLRRIRWNRQGAFFIIVWLMLLVPLMVDPFLEVQIGVAVFLIFLLVQRQQICKEQSDTSLPISK
jgi:O-antigen ligase